jgi:peptide/nickel transport system substrate-binding protein
MVRLVDGCPIRNERARRRHWLLHRRRRPNRAACPASASRGPAPKGRWSPIAWLACVCAVPAVLFCFGVPASAASTSSQPHSGGTLTILENTGSIGGWPDGLDPGTNTCCLVEDEPYNDAIFGQLFTQTSKGQAAPDLATGWKFLNGDKTVDIYLRHGVTFQDGTPFNAAAVVWNVKRDLIPANGGTTLLTSFPVASVATQGSYTVVLHLTKPFAPIINSLTSVAGPNWIASPTAYKKMGEKAFALKPVGAGPFEVVSDSVSAELVLKKFPHYWQAGHPYLNQVIYKTIGSDESSYNALLTGQAQVAQQVTTLSVVQTSQKNAKLRVVDTPGSGTAALQLNTKVAPFNNIKAREAAYYALDAQALNKVIAGGQGTVSESGDGPASLFPILNVPGYRTYDLAKAKALVKQLGGVSFTITGFAVTPQLTEAEQTEFEAAGMQTKITTVNLAQLVKAFQTGSWQATGGGAGGLDPAIGVGGMTWRAISNAPFTGIHDPVLDKMINAGAATVNHAARAAIYNQIYKYMSDEAYMPFLYAAPFYNITTTNVYGPGLSTPMYNTYLIGWPDIWTK